MVTREEHCMFLKQMEVQGFTLSSSPWEMTTIFQNFRISCGKPKAYANYLQLAFFTNISRNIKNLTGKLAATTWTETPLSCECALGVKNSAKWTASYQRAGIFSYAYKKKCVNIFNMLNLLNLLSKRKCFIESLTSSTREERAAGLHNNIIILPSKKQGGHYFCNLKKKLQ